MKRIVLVALVLRGCSSVTERKASTSLASPNAVGSYNLVTVNAEGLPAAVSVGGAQFMAPSALMDIRSRNTFSGNMSARNVATGMGMTKDFAGTWTQSGDSLTLIYDSGGCSDLAVVAGRRCELRLTARVGWSCYTTDNRKGAPTRGPATDGVWDALHRQKS